MTNDRTSGKKLLTYREAASVLNISERTLWSLVDKGELPAVRVGRSVRIDPADLRDYISASKVKGGQRG